MLMFFVGGIFIFTPLHQAQAEGLVSWALGGAVNIIPALLEGTGLIALVYFVGTLAFKLVVIGVDVGAWMVGIFLNPDIYIQVFGAEVIKTGWTICRDMCNLFFVLFLLIIAFATIFRVQAYNAKTLLPKFIFAIFLINFSQTIAMIVIDFGQIFMFEFVTWMGGDFSSATGCLSDQVHNWANNDFAVLNVKGGITDLLGLSFAMFYSVILMSTFFTLAGLLLIRIVALALVIVLSPFAFLMAVFPSTRAKSTEWWKNLVNYSLLGPVFIFFLFLATEMGKELTAGYVAPGPADASFDELGNFDQIVVGSIKNFVVIGMLLASVTLSKALAGAAGGMVIGGTAGLGLMTGKMYRGARYGKGKAGAVVRKPARVVGSKLGVQTGVNRLKDWGGKKIRGNKMTNFIAGEFTLQNEAGRQEKNRKETDKYAKLYKGQNADYLRDKVVNSKYSTPAQVAGAVQELQRNNKLEEKDLSKRNIENIKASGMDKEEFAKNAPQYAKDMGFGTKGQTPEEVTREFTERMVHDGEENKVGDLGLKNGAVISTIEDKHDDFSGWAAKRDKTSKESIQIGIEDRLATLQEEIADDSKGAENIYTTRDPKKKKKVEELQRVRAKIDKKGHKALNDLVLEDGKVKVNDKGKAVFSDEDTDESRKRKTKFAGEMKSGDFKSKEPEFFEEMAEYMEIAQADSLRKEGKGEQREALKRGAKAKNPELYKYLKDNPYYRDIKVGDSDEPEEEESDGGGGGGESGKPGYRPKANRGPRKKRIKPRTKAEAESEKESEIIMSDGGVPLENVDAEKSSGKGGGEGSNKKSIWKDDSASANLMGGGSKKLNKDEAPLSREEVIEKIGKTTTQVVDLLKEKPEEGLKKLDEIDNTWRKLVNENQEVFQAKGDNELVSHSMAAKQGMDGVRKVLRGKLAKQDKGSSDKVSVGKPNVKSSGAPAEPIETIKQPAKSDSKSQMPVEPQDENSNMTFADNQVLADKQKKLHALQKQKRILSAETGDLSKEKVLAMKNAKMNPLTRRSVKKYERDSLYSRNVNPPTKKIGEIDSKMLKNNKRSGDISKEILELEKEISEAEKSDLKPTVSRSAKTATPKKTVVKNTPPAKSQIKKVIANQTPKPQQSQKVDFKKLDADVTKSGSEIKNRLSKVSSYSQVLPNYFKRYSESLGNIADGLESSGVSKETAGLVKKIIVEQRKGTGEELIEKANFDLYNEGKIQKNGSIKDEWKHEEVDPNTYLNHLKKGDLQTNKVKEQLGKIDKALGNTDIMSSSGANVLSGGYTRARSLLQRAEKAQKEEQQVYLTMAKHILDSTEKALDDKEVVRELKNQIF